MRSEGVPPEQFYERLEGMGGNLLRENLSWNALEPNDDQFEWDLHDKSINNAPERVGIVLVFVDSPSWARDLNEEIADCWNVLGCRMPPAHNMLHEWQEFIRTAVSRYHDDNIVGVEVWNEPNYKTFWRAGGNEPSRWATLVVEAAEAVADVDPTIPIITGGLGPARQPGNPQLGIPQGDYLDAAYTANPKLADAVDAIGIHPYTAQRAPDDPSLGNLYAYTLSVIPPVRDEHDPGTPLWVTETGLYTGGLENAVTLTEQAEWLMDIYDDLNASNLGVEAMIIHTLYDPPGADDQKRHGLVRHNGDPKPAWTTFHNRFFP